MIKTSAERGKTSGSIASSPPNTRSRQHPSVPAPASPTPAKPNSLGSDLGFQVAHATPSKAKSNNTADITLLKKKPRLDARAIVEGYSNGRRDFAQEELHNLNLAKAKLPGVNFYQSKLTGADLSGADLSGADLGRTNLGHAILKNASLQGAYLGYADLEKADLRGADLSGANLRHANLRGTNLCGANLSDVQVNQEQIVLAKTNWLTIMPSGKRGFW
jgi:serine/threonine-protein kinase